jgi:hypothetical protein
MLDIEQAVERVQNKIKRASGDIWVYYLRDKFSATSHPDERIVNKLVGVYNSHLRTYQDSYVDDDLRWALANIKSYRV